MMSDLTVKVVWSGTPLNNPMFKGSVSSFRVYDRALNAQEVKIASNGITAQMVQPTIGDEAEDNLRARSLRAFF